MDYTKINPEIIDSLTRYVEQHCPTGGFLKAVLSNDLFDAVARADHENIRTIPEIAYYIYNELPDGCHGSRDKVQAWIDFGRKQREHEN